MKNYVQNMWLIGSKLKMSEVHRGFTFVRIPLSVGKNFWELLEIFKRDFRDSKQSCL